MTDFWSTPANAETAVSERSFDNGPITKGMYDLTVVKAEVVPYTEASMFTSGLNPAERQAILNSVPKEQHGQMFKIQFQIDTEGPFKGRRVFVDIPMPLAADAVDRRNFTVEQQAAAARRDMEGFFIRTGKPKNPNPMEWVGYSLCAEIIPKVGKQGKVRNEVRLYLNKDEAETGILKPTPEVASRVSPNRPRPVSSDEPPF